MSESGRGDKPRKRPSARRKGSRAETQATTAPGAAPKSPRKRVSARRAAAGSQPQAEGTATPSAPRTAAKSPRKKAASKATKAGRRAKPAAAEPSTEVPVAVTPSASVPGPTPPASVGARPGGMAQGSSEASLAPPGEPVGEDAWETVAEGVSPPEALQGAGGGGGVAGGASAGLGGVAGAASSNLTGHSQVAGPRQADALGSARAVLGTDYYYEQWGREGLRRQELDVDAFGHDPHFEQKVGPWLSGFMRRYFRLEVTGAENLPSDGRALLVANRSGLVPWDGLVLKEALRSAAPSLPALRWLSEDSVFYYPFLGVFMNRMGAVRACAENAERLLAQSSLVAVFPEGARGGGKLFRDRYQLERFGRGGYVRLALRNQVPVLPVAIVGGEDAYPMLARSKVLGKLLGTRYAAITPTFPALGAAGLLPAPAKWRIQIGEPLVLDEHSPAAANDSLVVHRVNDQVRRTLQGLLDRTVRARGPAFF